MAKEVEWPLKGWTFATKTDIARRKLCNRDACLLLLAANGPTCKTSLLKALLRAWRPAYTETKLLWGSKDQRGIRTTELDFGYLFNHYYGHIGTESMGKKYVPWTGATYKGPCWWWRDSRTMRGTCQISAAGYKRLEQLRQAIGFHHGEVLGAIDECLGRYEAQQAEVS